jgi:hypothetical protein
MLHVTGGSAQIRHCPLSRPAGGPPRADRKVQAVTAPKAGFNSGDTHLMSRYPVQFNDGSLPNNLESDTVEGAPRDSIRQHAALASRLLKS